MDAHVTGLPDSRKNTACTYDLVGNLAAYGYPIVVKHSRTYNALNRLTSLAVATGIGGSVALASFDYTLNPAGQRTNLVESLNTQPSTLNQAYVCPHSGRKRRVFIFRQGRWPQWHRTTPLFSRDAGRRPPWPRKAGFSSVGRACGHTGVTSLRRQGRFALVRRLYVPVMARMAS